MTASWSKEEIAELYHSPLLELVYKAATIHRENHNSQEVQVCTLLSIKTGACPENCSYCPQSAHYETGLEKEKLLSTERVLAAAKNAQDSGSTRFCMGAAWRKVNDNEDFEHVLDMVKGVNEMGMEVCVTLGMLNEHQAQRLKEAGLYAYNHNLDTSEEYYEKVISTRTYQDRLDTLESVGKSGISICSGGIIGMGETDADRIGMLHTLNQLPVPPESVPVNALVASPGTPLEKQKRVSVWEMIRMIATARIVFPKAMVRLSAGRMEMPVEEQAFCFMAGANSIFAGEKLLTTPNPSVNADQEMFKLLGLSPRKSFQQEEQAQKEKACMTQSLAALDQAEKLEATV